VPCSMREVCLRVCELSKEVHAACTGDVVAKQASKNAHDTGLDKQFTLYTCEGDWLS
jgi:hypothetical protein